jgi:hypothetical protein
MTDMVLVPREATPEMRRAALAELSDITVDEPKAATWDALRAHRAMLAAAPASGRVTKEQVEKMDLAYSIAFNEQMNHLVGTGMSSAEAIASASLAGLRAALASIGLECE